MTTPRIAILLCDSPHPTVQSTEGTYTDIFTRLLAASSLAPSGFALTPFDVVSSPGSYPDPQEFDLILLTGSTASAYLDTPWIVQLVAYIRSILVPAPKCKVVGICFGQQIIARALGVTVELNEKGWEVGPTEITLSDVGRKVFGTEESQMILQQMHRDHVVSVPSGYSLLASTDICAVHGFLATSSSDGKIQVLAVQGHPEFTELIVDLLVKARGEAGIFSPEIVEGVKKRKEEGWGEKVDGAKVADAMWRMATGEI